MITLEQYFIGREHSQDQSNNAVELLTRVNALIDEYRQTGVDMPLNPKTHSMISGDTNGGFRLQDCPIGAANSSHKQGQGVDVYDPENKLDDWVTVKLLRKHDLYREHPDSTPHWLHLTTRAPKSGCRTFLP